MAAIIDPSKDSESKQNYEKQTTEHYRSMDEFKDFIPLENTQKNVCGYFFLNRVDIATEKVPSRELDPRFEGHSYHIALRQSKFSAQIDKAMSRIFKHYLGYGSDVDIIQSGEDFYTASRTVKDAKHSEFVGENILEKDPLNPGPTFDESSGLASIEALAYFFGDSDFHARNWLWQQYKGKMLAYKIDSAESLDESMLKLPINKTEIDALPNISPEIHPAFEGYRLPKAVVSSPAFQKELKMMLNKIASTDFSVIRDILSEHITTNLASTFNFMDRYFGPLLKLDVETIKESCRKNNCSYEEWEGFLEDVRNSMNDESIRREESEKYDVHAILNLLEKRHLRLKEILDNQAREAFLPDYESITRNSEGRWLRDYLEAPVLDNTRKKYQKPILA